MKVILFHLIETSLILLIFQTSFALFFRNSGHFQLNRLLLITGLVISFVLPWINAPAGLNGTNLLAVNLPAIQPLMGGVETLVDSKNASGSLPLLILSAIWLSGAVLIGGGLLFRIVKIYSLIRGADKSQRLGYNFRESFRYPSFSFLNHMVIRPTDAPDDGTFLLIAAHERAHIRQWHTLDLLLAETACTLLWFNPFMYRYRKTLAENCEFLADRSALQQLKSVNVDNQRDLSISCSDNNADTLVALPSTVKTTYARLIVKLAGTLESEVSPGRPMPIHSFHQSQTKRRLQMLNQKNKRSILMYALLIPTLLASFLLHACSSDLNSPSDLQNNEEAILEHNAQQDGGPLDKVEKMPEFKGGTQALYAYLGENIQYPETAKKAKLSGKTFVEFVVDTDGSIRDAKVLRGFNADCDKEALRAISEMPKWIPGENEGKTVSVKMVLPIMFALD